MQKLVKEFNKPLEEVEKEFTKYKSDNHPSLRIYNMLRSSYLKQKKLEST